MYVGGANEHDEIDVWMDGYLMCDSMHRGIPLDSRGGLWLHRPVISSAGNALCRLNMDRPIVTSVGSAAVTNA